jgi:hypothetical protein
MGNSKTILQFFNIIIIKIKINHLILIFNKNEINKIQIYNKV